MISCKCKEHSVLNSSRMSMRNPRCSRFCKRWGRGWLGFTMDRHICFI